MGRELAALAGLTRGTNPTDMTSIPPFHLALPVRDLERAREFYCELLGCGIGRTSERWIDLDLYGHQVTLHLAENYEPREAHNPVDDHAVPVPHFGVVLDMPAWRALADRLQGAGVDFVIAPYVRFAGKIGEQGTLFLRDPSGNALEFKGFQSAEQLFESPTSEHRAIVSDSTPGGLRPGR